MKTTAKIMMVLVLLFAIAVAFTAYAVSYPILEEHRQVKEKAIMKAGMIVYLFHSGTPDVKKAIGVNDVLLVYREGPSCEQKEVGKIRVLSYASKNFIKAVVVEGEIRFDDIAKRGAVACLVILSDDTCK